jgi:two-component system sensor histidine kinase/response regulator
VQRLKVSGYLPKPIKQSELFDAIVSSMGEPKSKRKTPPERKKRRTKPGLRILLAEDNPVNQMWESRLLEKLGHVVTIVNNGKEAVSAAEKNEFDLIVMDVQMPEMDGLEAASIIRDRQKITEHQIPILALTAHATAEDRERCLAVGMDAYLSKPVRIADLQDAVALIFENATEQKRNQRTGRKAASSPSLIDEQKVLEGLGGDRELLADVLRLFIEDSDRLLRDMRAVIALQDAVALGRTAHALKGSIANLSAGAAHACATELENAAKRGEFSSAPELVGRLEKELQALRRAASQVLRKYGPVRPGAKGVIGAA